MEDDLPCGECHLKPAEVCDICGKKEDRMSSSHKDIPEYDETVTCDNPECKHVEAPAITGLYGIAGGGGLGVYSVCEHCGTVLTKSLDLEANDVCDTQAVELKDVADDTKPGTDEHK